MTYRLLALAGTVLLATACGFGDVDQESATGKRAFAECAACHTTAPPDTPAGSMRLVGPNLFGVYMAPAARLEDFAYSRAMQESGLVWDEATLDAFIARPQEVVRGNRMGFPGQSDPEKRKAIIEYLKTLK